VHEPDDVSLLDRWRGGDEGAGQSLFQRHFKSIYSFFRTKCEAEADELVQSTFLALLRAKEQFRKQASFRTYLFTIARHELYRVLRNRQRDGERLDFAVSSIAQLITTPGSRLARNEEHRRLVEALRRLPVETQTLLELHYWEDLGMAELADVFEVNEVAIRKRLSRAREALRIELESTAPREALETLETMDAWAKGLSESKLPM
jgi:RNA polymerase sigma factor (sigma-70 family)